MAHWSLWTRRSGNRSVVRRALAYAAQSIRRKAISLAEQTTWRTAPSPLEDATSESLCSTFDVPAAPACKCHCTAIQCESKNPPKIFWYFFLKRLGIFSPNFIHLLCVPIYAGLQFFYPIICNFDEVMRCRIKRDHTVHTMFTMFTIGRNARWHFLTFSPYSRNFFIQILHSYYTLLPTLDYKFFIQLCPTVTKLCRIKCDHPAFQPMVDIEHIIMMVALNME